MRPVAGLRRFSVSLLQKIAGLILLPFILVAAVIALLVCKSDPEYEYELDCGWWG